MNITHPQLVAALLKSGEALVAEITPLKAHLNHMAIGVCSEAGELADALKKHTMYDKSIDHANVVEELGDLEFFIEGIRSGLGITREETLEANIRKLSVRYEKLSYSNHAAQSRADKQIDHSENDE